MLVCLRVSEEVGYRCTFGDLYFCFLPIPRSSSLISIVLALNTIIIMSLSRS